MYTHILIPTDGSELSNQAAQAAVQLAKATGARLTALFVAPPPTPIVYDKLMPVGYMTPEQHADLIERAAAMYLGAIEKAAADAGVPCETARVTGDFPADEIVKAANERGCDLIMMASHGRRGLSGFVLGSETNKVLTHAKVPVLVHRQPAA
jgi:nucleotide-binding universal stress UspA family protein